MKTNLLEQAQELFPYTQALRRDFHQNPELGFQEARTAGVVAETLTRLGLEVRRGVGQTGVVALLEGTKALAGVERRPVVMLRFDMDALPIQEETGAEYASRIPGVMHACGHDGHVAIGLTVARLLVERRAELRGTVKFVFQPAEEGAGGAKAMVEAGALENPRPDYALGLHLWNEKPVGWLGAMEGPLMAAAEKFNLRLRGRGGHGATPHLTIDPLVAAAHVITGLQSIVSRNVPPLKTAVLSVGAVHGGQAFNVIPQEVELQGTIRTFEPGVRDLVLVRFCQVVETVAAAYGCKAEIDLQSITPAVINDSEVTGLVQAVAESLFSQMTLDRHCPTMGSEDMAYFLQEVPGCFFFVGSANPARGLDAPHHHPRFDIDESALPIAVAWMAAAVQQLLK